jgi:polyphosphate kinase
VPEEWTQPVGDGDLAYPLSIAVHAAAIARGEPHRAASAAVEQFLLDELQVAEVINAQPTDHETQFVCTLGYLSQERAHAHVKTLYQPTLGELMPALASAGVRIVSWSDLGATQQVSLGAFFRDAVLPVLTPLAIDLSRPFPLLSSLSLNLALRLDAAPGRTEHRLAIVQVPLVLTRLVPVAKPGVFVWNRSSASCGAGGEVV